MPYINNALLLLLVCFNVSANSIDEQFDEAYVNITATLEVVNTLGQHCDHQLNTYGAKGVQSKECDTYIKSHSKGGVLYNVMEPCAVAYQWVKAKQALTQGQTEYIETYPIEASIILRKLKWVHQVCPPKNPDGYEYIHKTMTKIRLLNAK